MLLDRWRPGRWLLGYLVGDKTDDSNRLLVIISLLRLQITLLRLFAPKMIRLSAEQKLALLELAEPLGRSYVSGYAYSIVNTSGRCPASVGNAK